MLFFGFFFVKPISKNTTMQATLLTLLLTATTLCVNAQFFEQLTPPGGGGYYKLKRNNLGELFITVGNAGIFKSVDKGNTWDSIGWEGFAGVLELNTQNNDLFVGNSFGIKYSSDEGQTWMPTVYTEPSLNLQIIESGDILISNWGKIYKMNYSGTQVVLAYSPDIFTEVRDILEHPNGFLIAGLMPRFIAEYTILKSFDNGDTWSTTDLIDRGVLSLAINSLGDIYSGQTAQYSLGLYKSTDHALTWEYILDDRNIKAIYITPDDVIYLGCSFQIGPFGGVMRSTNDGQTWENLLSGTYRIENFETSKDWFLFCGGSSSYTKLFRSLQPVWDSTYRTRITVVPEGAGVVSGGGVFFHGTTASLTAIPNSNYRFDKWVVNRQELDSDSLIDLQMIRPMYVTAKFKLLSNIEGVEDLDLKFFPNPATDHITIENLQRGYNEILFYDVAGIIKFAQTVVDKSKITLPISNLPKGIYIVKINNENTKQIFRFVKL